MDGKSNRYPCLSMKKTTVSQEEPAGHSVTKGNAYEYHLSACHPAD